MLLSSAIGEEAVRVPAKTQSGKRVLPAFWACSSVLLPWWFLAARLFAEESREGKLLKKCVGLSVQADSPVSAKTTQGCLPQLLTAGPPYHSPLLAEESRLAAEIRQRTLCTKQFIKKRLIISLSGAKPVLVRFGQGRMEKQMGTWV